MKREDRNALRQERDNFFSIARRPDRSIDPFLRYSTLLATLLKIKTMLRRCQICENRLLSLYPNDQIRNRDVWYSPGRLYFTALLANQTTDNGTLHSKQKFRCFSTSSIISNTYNRYNEQEREREREQLQTFSAWYHLGWLFLFACSSERWIGINEP